MKRKRWLALLSVGLVALGAQQAWAWGCKCNNKYSTYICCRPYNAFSPVCFGSICCDGCCPLQCGGGHSWSPACHTPPFIPPAMCAPTMMPPPCDPCGGYGYPPPGYPPCDPCCGGGFPGAGYAGPGYPYMLTPPPFNGPPPVFGQPPVAGPGWGAPGTRPAHYPRGVYPGFWPNYPAGYWTSAYAPWPNGPPGPYGPGPYGPPAPYGPPGPH